MDLEYLHFFYLELCPSMRILGSLSFYEFRVLGKGENDCQKLLSPAFSPIPTIFEKPLLSGSWKFLDCVLKVKMTDLIFNSFLTDDDTRSFCGQCRSRSDCTEHAV